MRAARIHAFGDASVIVVEQVDVPKPKADEVLVRVIASSVNPIEWKIRSGAMAQAIGRDLPVTLGWDCAGIVETVGSSVTRFKRGDAVFSYPEFAAGGTHAEFVAIKATQVALKPSTISFVDAAALPMTAGAAWQCIVAVGDAKRGTRVLIHGASGGVGTIALQLANIKGAHVVATASGANAELVAALGADQVIDYRTTPFESVAREIDLVVDLIGGETQERSWAVMKRGALLVATPAPPSQERAQAAGVRATFVFTPPRGDILAEIAALADAGKLRPIIGREMALANVREAHELGQSGNATGKIVLHVAAP
jgi:NADPH:quinone reductase-like Zn-dependent oxidoreductase